MNKVGRPKKLRKVQKVPKISQFSPRGKAGRPDEVIVTIDELEAIKLADYQGLDQINGAMAMGVSRPSFGRIVRAARRKIARALVDGKIIRISGGSVRYSDHTVTNFTLSESSSDLKNLSL